MKINVPPPADSISDDALLGSGAGARSVRGGALRLLGYLAGSALAAGASVVLLRYLGVVDFGRYVTVMSLISIVTGVSDVGLTLVGQREYVLQANDQARRNLVANILGIRLLITPVAVGLGVLFAITAGYTRTLVLGTVIVGASVVFGNLALTFTIPLTVELRLGAVTVTEVAKQAFFVAGNALLVVAGATLLFFFSIPVAAALGSALLAGLFVGRRSLSWPRFDWSAWRLILREAAPMGAAVIVSALYLRTLVVMSSLLTNAYQTGLFATSYRVLEILAAIPGLMVASAFPIMAKAAFNDEKRLRYILQRLIEASFLIAVLLIVVMTIAAGPIVRILGGSSYEPAANVLRIQCFALFGSFASVIWTTALIAIRRQSALVLINTVALVAVAAFGGALIPIYGARGAAVAAIAGELLLALVSLAMLLRAQPALRPDGRFVVKLALAAAGGLCCDLIPELPALLTATISALVYALIAFSLGAVPSEATTAMKTWSSRMTQRRR